MLLIVGLGNPGKDYALNRHNVGFMAADVVAAQYGFPSFAKKFKAQFAEGKIGRGKVLLLKPQTYMNLSGESVQAAAQFYKIPLDHILVMHDEVDLPFGEMRLKQGGGDAGHNGLKSVTQHLGGDYLRLRIGVGRPEGGKDVGDYVLSNFSKAEFKALEPALFHIADHVMDDVTRFRAQGAKQMKLGA